MRAVNAEEQLVAVITAHGRDQADYARLRGRAREVGLTEDGAFVVRLDRVVIELLLREHLSSAATREDIMPPLLARRTQLSWWRPNGSAVAAREACTFVAADPDVLCAVPIPFAIKIWVMGALAGWEP